MGDVLQGGSRERDDTIYFLIGDFLERFPYIEFKRVFAARDSIHINPPSRDTYRQCALARFSRGARVYGSAHIRLLWA